MPEMLLPDEAIYFRCCAGASLKKIKREIDRCFRGSPERKVYAARITKVISRCEMTDSDGWCWPAEYVLGITAEFCNPGEEQIGDHGISALAEEIHKLAN